MDEVRDTEFYKKYQQMGKNKDIIVPLQPADHANAQTHLHHQKKSCLAGRRFAGNIATNLFLLMLVQNCG